jgi:hypothetical protein
MDRLGPLHRIVPPTRLLDFVRAPYNGGMSATASGLHNRRSAQTIAYDPRADTGIPTEQVGSLPRPSKLQAAYEQYDAGAIEKHKLEAEQDEAAQDSIHRLEATWSPIVSDGEQRWSSFSTYPVTDTLEGTGLAPNFAPRGSVHRDFRRRTSPAVASTDGWTLQVPDVCGRLVEKVHCVRYQAYEVGGDCPLHARAALSAQRRGAGLLA